MNVDQAKRTIAALRRWAKRGITVISPASDVELLALCDRADDATVRAEKAEAALMEARRQRGTVLAAHDVTLNKLNEAQAECERLRADAERYRWLRAHFFGCDFHYFDVGSDLDATLDAAIDVGKSK